VLDHGFVALVDYMGSDDSIERAARVSYGYGTRRSSQTRGLIRYLRRHRHTTPSEMVELKFHCAMPMFVARQWIRHRTANVNEYSGRYSLMPLLFYTPSPRTSRCRASRTTRAGPDQAADAALYRERRALGAAAREAHGDVRLAGRRGRGARDRAHRAAAVDLHAVVLEDRPAQPAALPDAARDPHAQLEIRAYAEVMAGMVKRVAPLTYEAWIDYDVGGAHTSAAASWPRCASCSTPDGARDARRRRVAGRGGAGRARSCRPRGRELLDKLQPRRRTSSSTSRACGPPPRSRRRCMARRSVPGPRGRRVSRRPPVVAQRTTA
jgi:thymidylate synthase (FAD)